MPIAVDLHTMPHLDNRSELLKLQGRTVKGKVNACPFGCGFKDLDEAGYCVHLIGFTDNGKTYEPMVRETVLDKRTGKLRATGRKVVRCRMVQVGTVPELDPETDETVMVPIFEPIQEKLQKGDQLVRISTSYRVYRATQGQAPTKGRLEAVEAATQEEKDRILRDQVSSMARTTPGQPQFAAMPMESFAEVTDESV